MSALVGLDVGTSGVKALALSRDGEVLARAEHGYGLETPQRTAAECLELESAPACAV